MSSSNSKCTYIFCTFHVAGGMNGSIVYELERPENAGLKKSVKACSVSLFSHSPSTTSISITIWRIPHDSEVVMALRQISFLTF